MAPVNSMRCFISLLLCLAGFLNYPVEAKPANAFPSDASSSKSFHPSHPVEQRSLGSNSGRKVLTSWNEDGSWQASARLPTSSQAGGNDHSRYKIRRDGSLSLALQIPKPHLLFSGGNHNHQSSLGELMSSPSAFDTSSWAARGGKTGGQSDDSNDNDGRGRTAKHFSPAELRSFSVVISDVDVLGNYNNNNVNDADNQDAYSKAGVESYHLKSNSIHRMNASWKLKPSHVTPSSSDLLEFLSYFASGDRATRSDQESEHEEIHGQQKEKKPVRKILGQHEDDEEEDDIKQPFLTWSESSRNIPLSSSTEVVYKNTPTEIETASLNNKDNDANVAFNKNATTVGEEGTMFAVHSPVNVSSASDTQSDNSEFGSTEEKVVLHELISTLEKLNENTEERDTSSNVEKLDTNPSKNTSSAIHENGGDVGVSSSQSLQQPRQQVELDQTATEPENKRQPQQHHEQVDVKTTESLLEEEGKEDEEGDVFVESDTAKSLSNANTTHNSTSVPISAVAELSTFTANGERSAKSAFFDSKTKSTTSTNRNGRNNDYSNARGTSTTSLKTEDSKQRMKTADPQQTASDLKKLMSLILKSDGNRNGGGGGGDVNKSGAQIVNIVITPNQDAISYTSHNPPASAMQQPQQKNNPQRILFLKTPQVKQMLDIALTDPAVSSAAQKIAAALETNPFPNPIPTNIEHTYNNFLPTYLAANLSNNNMHKVTAPNKPHTSFLNDLKTEDDDDTGNPNVPSTPNGFPLTGTGFLNLHHPNLQFHQALHHLVVNGTTPTSINATTKTNIINIFVINFKETDSHPTGGVSANAQNQSPFKINIKPQQTGVYKPQWPFQTASFKPPLIESVSPSSDPTLFFNNKMGLAAAVGTAANNKPHDNVPVHVAGDEGISSEKNYEPNKNLGTLSSGNQFDLSNSDKINIFDLLPGDIGTVTSVQYAPGVDTENKKDDNHNQHHLHNQTILPSNDNGNANSNNRMSTMKPATMSYSDYFADFLPDRGRDPPGIEKPQESENINEQDILSILTSSQRKPAITPSPFPTENTPLPPNMAHLEWIFKNQSPPKPQIPQTALIKRKGTDTFSGLTSIEEGSDSMMEPEETSNSPFHHVSSTQDLVEYLLKLQNVTRPPDSNLLENSTNNHYHHSHNSEFSGEHQVVEYTTKPPAFWKFGTKIPIGSFTNTNTEEALNNRLRKVLTAFGYSALPTIAAGAAATWPYWVPLVATGRRRRRSPFSSHNRREDENISKIAKTSDQFLFSNNASVHASEELRKMTQNASTILPIILGPSNRRLLSKSTKNNRGEGVGEQKWIKVDVITTAHPSSPSSESSPPSSSISIASPTLLNLEMSSHPHHHPRENGTSFHSESYKSPDSKNINGNSGSATSSHQRKEGNKDYSQEQKQHHQELDLPLLKNFLKNVLYNELNLSTNVPSPLLVSMQNAQKLNYEHEHHHRPPPSPPPLVISPFSLSPSSTSPPTEPVVLSQYPIFTSNLNKMNNGHLFASSSVAQTQGANNNGPGLLNIFAHSSSSALFPDKEHNNGGDDEQMIAGSDKKVISIAQFTTPSPTSVYIHNRGDGTTSTVTSSSISSSSSHKQSTPWGSSFGKPDKISTTTVSTFTNIPDGSHHSALTQIFNGVNNLDYHHAVDHYQANEKKRQELQKYKLANSIRAAESTTKTDMTNGRRTIDIDSTQQKKKEHLLMSSALTVSGNNFPPVRSQRRLHKWNDKTDELTAAAEEDDNEMSDDTEENGPLVQSLSAMASHLMNTKNGGGGEDSLENSSERDVYLSDRGQTGVTTPFDDQEAESDTEETASEEDSTDQADIVNNERKHGGNDNDRGGEEDEDEMELHAKLKSDHVATTPKGLTTWSAVNAPSKMPMHNSKVTNHHKVPLEYTISSVLSFSTERPTTQEMVVIQERLTPTTEPTKRITSKVNTMSASSSVKNKRKPLNKNKKVPPSKFVKPQLEEVTAEVTSIDDTHVVYKTKVTTEGPEMKSTGVTDFYDRFTTRKPLWPYQMTTRRVTKRPVPFSRVTTRPKNPYAKRPQIATTSTTTTPATTTTYLRNPQTSIISPISGLTLSLTDMPFMDFLRSQIIPRIGLTLISFMASTPLFLSLLGAGFRRKKRSISADFSSANGKALFESKARLQPESERFDFSAIQKKLEDAMMKSPSRRRVIGSTNANSVAPHTNSFDLITEAFRHLARWWATKSAPPKSRTLNNEAEGKQRHM